MVVTCWAGDCRCSVQVAGTRMVGIIRAAGLPAAYMSPSLPTGAATALPHLNDQTADAHPCHSLLRSH